MVWLMVWGLKIDYMAHTREPFQAVCKRHTAIAASGHIGQLRLRTCNATKHSAATSNAPIMNRKPPVNDAVAPTSQPTMICAKKPPIRCS